MIDHAHGHVAHFEAPQNQLIVVAHVPITGTRELGQVFVAGVAPARLRDVRVLEGEERATILGVFLPVRWTPGRTRLVGDALILPSVPLIVNFLPTDAAVAMAKQMDRPFVVVTIVVDIDQ